MTNFDSQQTRNQSSTGDLRISSSVCHIRAISACAELAVLRIFFHSCLNLVICASLVSPCCRAAEVDTDFFEAKIRPVLIEHCYDCHSTDAAEKNKLKAELLLDSRDGLLRGGESGTALVPGDATTSLLIQSLLHTDDAPAMPPKGKLPAAVIEDFVTWVRGGAPDPRAATARPAKRGMSIDAGRAFWSFVPAKPSELPAPHSNMQAESAIDRFVGEGLRQADLEPSGLAEKSSWLRRVYFDLHGLPPTVDQLAAFESDDSPAAREMIVDELLSSPFFGQRWGRHWLDSVRYADSNGRDRNVFWYSAWRYRDYVIDSFNRDKPLDQFIREQIAGDLLPFSSIAERDEQRIATGFLALGPKAFEEQKPEVFRMDVIDEQIEVIGRSILGLSIGCARCHDHKFDPIPTKDYYAMAGILRSTQPLYGYGPKGINATNHHHSELQAIGPEAESLSAAGLAYIEHLNQLTLIQNTARSDRYRVVRKVADAKLQLANGAADSNKLTADIQRMEAEIKEWDLVVRAAEDDLQCAMEAPPEMPDWAMGAREGTKFDDCRVHVRGDTNNLGDTVARGVLQVLPNAIKSLPQDASGRLQFADWLADPHNPLTARVYVNRVWQRLFGRGLVATADDFGVNGTAPSHPQLLDHLSLHFMEKNWSTKSLLRELVLSRTYASDSRFLPTNYHRDPDNIYLWRMPARRIEAEVFRDAIMMVSGQLDFASPRRATSVFARLYPWRDVEYRTFSPEFLPDQIDHPYRSVFLPVVRGVLPPIFQLFDFAAPDRPIAVRDQSTVPAQSLFLMNSDWVTQQARFYATFILEKNFADDRARIQYLYRSAFAREPTADELGDSLEYLDLGGQRNTTAGFEQSTGAIFERWTNLCQTVLASAEFRYLK